MIGTIRKHSGVLWSVIITATIISFIFWGASSSRLVNGGSGVSNLGTVYGHKVTPDQYQRAKRDFFISYYMRSGTWPDRTAMTANQLEQQVYLNIMFLQKAEQLGIHVSEDAVAAAASTRLASIARNGQPIPLDSLIQQALGPAGFNAADFESYIRHDLMIQQLVQAVGLSGNLITPQEIARVTEGYRRTAGYSLAALERGVSLLEEPFPA